MTLLIIIELSESIREYEMVIEFAYVNIYLMHLSFLLPWPLPFPHLLHQFTSTYSSSSSSSPASPASHPTPSSSPHYPTNPKTSKQQASLPPQCHPRRPPQSLSFVIDSGSELSRVRCSNNSASAALANSSSFFLLNSSTYSTIPCSSQICTDKAGDLPTPAAYRNAGQCHVILSYASASASEVSLSGDTFHLQTYVGMVFCCMDSSYSTTPEEDEKNTGLLGMNRGALADHPYGLPALLLLHLRRGLRRLSPPRRRRRRRRRCSPPQLRHLRPTPLPLTYFDRVAYSVQLEAIRVSANLLPLPKSAFVPDHNGAVQTMLDTCAQFTFLIGPSIVLSEPSSCHKKGDANRCARVHIRRCSGPVL